VIIGVCTVIVHALDGPPGPPPGGRYA